MPTSITTAKVLYIVELQDAPSKVLDCVISAWLGDGTFAPGEAPPWTSIQTETVRLIERALPGWWWIIGFAESGGIEFTIEPRPDGSAAHLLDLMDVDPMVRAVAELDGKHLCIVMVEAIFRARLLIERYPSPRRP